MVECAPHSFVHLDPISKNKIGLANDAMFKGKFLLAEA